MLTRANLTLLESFVLTYSKRGLSSVPIKISNFREHRALVVEKYGRTEDVVLQVRKPEEVLPNQLEPNQILVEHLLSCIHPADINMIQGVYGIKPKVPFIPGNEGVMRVKQVGTRVKHLKEGSLAIPVNYVGCWQSYSVQDSQNFFAVDGDLNGIQACQLKVNPSTAYRMLKDFAELKPGDCVIQNAANSAVGVYVIQLAKHWGLKTINVIRDRANKQEVIQELNQFGADIVVTEEEVSNREIMAPIIGALGKPKLLMNCVGGKNADNCAKLLADGAVSVTYGAMSRQPFNPSTSSLIFKQHKYVGFWLSQWFDDRYINRRSEVQSLVDELAGLFKRGVLKPKLAELINFEDRLSAFNIWSSSNKKYLFSISRD